jgi:REP element-mobilizing transposase RayT
MKKLIKVLSKTVAAVYSACTEMGIKIIDIAVNVIHVHLFLQYPPKYSVGFIAKKIHRVLREGTMV